MSVTDLVDIVGAVLFWSVMIWNIFSVKDVFIRYLKSKTRAKEE